MIDFKNPSWENQLHLPDENDYRSKGEYANYLLSNLAEVACDDHKDPAYQKAIVQATQQTIRRQDWYERAVLTDLGILHGTETRAGKIDLLSDVKLNSRSLNGICRRDSSRFCGTLSRHRISVCKRSGHW